MKLKWFHHGVLGFLFGLLFFSVPFSAQAMEIFEREIVMEQFGNMLYSPIIEEDQLFNTVTLQLDREAEGMMVNFNPLVGGIWEPFEVHDDGFGPEALLFSSPTKTVQFRKFTNGEDGRLVLDADIFFAEDGSLEASNEYLYSGPEVAMADIKVISRRNWGADENLRYWSPEIEELFRSNGKSKDYVNPCGDMDERYANETRTSRTIKRGPKGEQLVWPMTYVRDVQKIVIHHTDSDLRDLNGDLRMDGRDYRAMVQAIYYFHAITRGWGDIGYNYIIDPLGNVYEGRYGGDKVIGAHAQCYNNGSMGIAIIGNYETNRVPEPALNTLITLIARKAKAFGIDPQGESIFRGKRLFNVIGHRDVRPTSCPGKKLYSLLPRIRERSALAIRSGAFRETNFSTQTLDYNAEAQSSVATISMTPNERSTIKLRFKNTGKKTWDRNTWMHVALNNKEHARVVPVIEGKNFVAADMREHSVSPGQTATFEVEFEAGYNPGTYTFELAPVVNGRYKVSRSAVFVPVQVEAPLFDYRIVKETLPSGVVFEGQRLFATLKLQNIGNVKWVNYGDHPIRLGTEGPRDHNTLLIKKRTARIAHLLESEVFPGEVGTFVFDLEVPLSYTGKLRERFTPVIEGIRWLDDRGMSFEVAVKKPIHQARIKSKTKVPKLLPGEMKKIEITMENKGDLPWDQDNMYINLLGRGIQVFKKKLTPLKPVNPKQEVNFGFWIEAPYEEGRHRVFLQSKFNRVPIRGGTARFLIDVPKPKLRAQMVGQTSRMVNLKPGQEKEVEVKFKNLGNTVWKNKGSHVIHLAPTRPQDRLSKLYYEESWENKFRAAAMEEKEVYPGEVGTFRFKVKPNRKGVFRENFQLVIEQVGWIDGSFVRWDFRVFGDTVKNSIDTSEDSRLNQERASVITRARREVITRTVTPVVQEPEPAPVEIVKYVEPIQKDIFRVRLTYDDDNSSFTADKSYKVLGEGGELLFDASAGRIVSLRRVYENIHVQLDGKVKTTGVVRIIPSSGGIVEIKSMERRPTWNNRLNDNRFRGAVEVRPVNNKTAYINELPLEDYIKGLAEVSNSAPYEKQKAIAILARTYARFYMSDENRKFPGLPYDGSDDPAIFQRYLGYGYELRSPNFLKAAAATDGQVVTYNGELIKTPYFSQSNGQTRSAQDVWGWTNTPYLQSVADPYCRGMIQRGHGVGLSGCGSEAMAERDKKYDEIIKYYYQGVQIQKLDF